MARRAVPAAKVVSQVRERLRKLEETRETLDREQKRLDGYLKSLGGEGNTEGGAAALVRRILANEDVRKALEQKVETVQQELETRTGALRSALMPLVPTNDEPRDARRRS
ncbi:hypothetical protein ACFL6C_10310 [Myxococcota bacterium]